jgi:hypothetical protein
VNRTRSKRCNTLIVSRRGTISRQLQTESIRRSAVVSNVASRDSMFCLYAVRNVCALAKMLLLPPQGIIFLGQGCDVIRNQFYSIQISLRCVLVCDLLIDYGDQVCNFVSLVFSEGADSVGSDGY